MNKSWWDIGSVYQIYPRSFQDADGDGVGDLNGITSRLDYLNKVGIEAVWISPFFPSPMTDFGYDVSNYVDVDPTFGNLDDFKKLLAEAHRRQIKIMIDLVPCHTSDQHDWFKEARSSRDNPKRDYYVWRDPKDDGDVPNNWISLAGGSSWTLDGTTGQYYLHSFLSTQPDLNWDNPKVREEMKNVVRFWFDLGVDGLRVDAIWGISKDPEFRDDSLNPDYHGEPGKYGQFIHDRCKHGPNFKQYLNELSEVCDEYRDKQIVFEFYPDEQLGDIYDQYKSIMSLHPSSSAFFMEHRKNHWHADDTTYSLDRYTNYSAQGSLPFFCLGNHDQPRVVSRIGYERARALNFLNLLMPGISVVYYGDELGMENGQLDTEQIQDTFSPANSIFDSRDLERTPMQWDNTEFAGFSKNKPWLPVHENRHSVNVESEFSQPTSMLRMHQRLLKLRQTIPVLIHGSLEPIETDNGYVLAFKRQQGSTTLYVVVNFADSRQTVTLPGNFDIITSTHELSDYQIHEKQLTLPGYGGTLVFVN